MLCAFYSVLCEVCSVKATVENPRGSVEKLSPKESVELGCRHCAKGQCEGSRGIFRGQTRGCKTEGEGSGNVDIFFFFVF